MASRAAADRPKMRRIVDPLICRPGSLCWPNALPVSSASLAVRHVIGELVVELCESGQWTGIELREPPARPAAV